MAYIRQQRTQAGYNPNLRHVLHGLDADLIMLGLALHEAHFTVLREEVLFGRQKFEGRNNQEQSTFDLLKGNGGLDRIPGEDRWVYSKPLILLQVATLREYLAVEFACLQHTLPFTWDFERIVDDFVFLCFFVGNDFLPHLPTLDIRDGAIDFLYNVYKRILPTLGDYLTKPGGDVNLENVDVVLAEVGAIEDEVFQRRKAAEDSEQMRRAQQKAARKVGIKNNRDAFERIAAGASDDRRNAVPVGQAKRERDKEAAAKEAAAKAQLAASSEANKSAAAALRAALLKKQLSTTSQPPAAQTSTSAAPSDPSAGPAGTAGGEQGGAVKEEQSDKPSQADQAASSHSGASPGALERSSSTKTEDGLDEFLVVAPDEPVPALLDSTARLARQREKDDRAKALDAKYQQKCQAMLDEYRDKIQDEVRFWQAGWKDRYYADKYKEKDIAKGGGRERVFREYITGLCWVLKYYYDGCASWKWYYPFHYAPFASDLKNIERYATNFEDSEPFRPIEQLMAVLPKESADALPAPCRKLMLDPKSPIADFYPEEVELDPNGKPMPWLWVVLLPFIDEDRLLEELRRIYPQFDEESQDRNRFRDASIFFNAQAAPPGLISAADTMAPADLEGGGEESTVPLDCQSAGVGGTLVKPGPKATHHLYQTLSSGAALAAPSEPPGRWADITANQAIAFSYRFPPKSPHLSQLLPGALLPPPKLTQQDFAPRRPRLNRGMNIADLGRGRDAGPPRPAPLAGGYGRGSLGGPGMNAAPLWQQQQLMGHPYHAPAARPLLGLAPHMHHMPHAPLLPNPVAPGALAHAVPNGRPFSFAHPGAAPPRALPVYPAYPTGTPVHPSFSGYPMPGALARGYAGASISHHQPPPFKRPRTSPAAYNPPQTLVAAQPHVGAPHSFAHPGRPGARAMPPGAPVRPAPPAQASLDSLRAGLAATLAQRGAPNNRRREQQPPGFFSAPRR